jgi:hypothetical protein
VAANTNSISIVNAGYFMRGCESIAANCQLRGKILKKTFASCGYCLIILVRH